MRGQRECVRGTRVRFSVYVRACVRECVRARVLPGRVHATQRLFNG